MRLKIGYIDIGDGCCRRYVSMTTLRYWWRFWQFWSPTYTIFLHYVGHPHSKDVTNIEFQSPPSKNRHQLWVTNIDLALKLPEYSTGQWPVPFTQISFQTWKFHTESPENPSSGSLVSLFMVSKVTTQNNQKFFENYFDKFSKNFLEIFVWHFLNRPNEFINCHSVFCIMSRCKIGYGTGRNTDTSHQGCKETGKYPTLAIFHWFTCFHELFNNFHFSGSKISWSQDQKDHMKNIISRRV